MALVLHFHVMLYHFMVLTMYRWWYDIHISSRLSCLMRARVYLLIVARLSPAWQIILGSVIVWIK